MTELYVVAALLLLCLFLYSLVYVYIRMEINALHQEVVRMYRETKSELATQRQEIVLLRSRIRRSNATYREDTK